MWTDVLDQTQTPPVALLPGGGKAQSSHEQGDASGLSRSVASVASSAASMEVEDDGQGEPPDMATVVRSMVFT